MIRGSLLIVLFFLILSAFAQTTSHTQTIRGKITESVTKLPIPGASIILLNSNPIIGTVSATDGSFRIDKAPTGRINIEITCMGYKKVIMSNLLLNSAKELILNVELEEEIYSLKDVKVSAASKKDQAINEMAVISARSFNTEDAERYAGSLGDPARMASNFAGVSTSSDQRNDIIIRGNSPQALAWRLEGVDIPNPNHFASYGSTGGAISILNNNVLSQSDFYTGAFPASFGNALSGAFDLNMRNGNNEKHEFIGQFGFNGFELDAEGPMTKNHSSSYLASVRYSTLELFHAMGMDFGTGNAIPQYRDMSFKVNIPLKNYNRISVFGLAGNSYIELLDSKGDSAGYGLSGSDLYLDNIMGITGISYLYYFKNQSKLLTSLNASRVSSRMEYTDLSLHLNIPQAIEKLAESKYSITSTYSQKLNSKNNFSLGYIFDIYDVDYQGMAYDTSISKYINFISADGTPALSRLFISWQHKFNDKVSLVSGLHNMLFHYNSTWSSEPRLALEYRITGNQKFSAGIGLHSQTQLKIVHYMADLVDTLNMIYQVTNKNLDLSKSLHFVLGYDFQFDENHRIKAETYYQHLYNIPVAQQNPQYSFLVTGGDYGYQVYSNMMNSGTGTNYGVEVTLEKFISKGFYYLFTASVFEATYKGSDGITRNSRFNNNYVFNLLAGYEISLNKNNALIFDIKSIYAGGQRYVPIDAAASKLAKTAVYDWPHAFEKKYPDYFRLNARFGYRKNGKKTNQEIALDLQNMTNHKNVFTENWNNTIEEVVISYQMGLLPMVTYRIYF